MNGRRKLGLIAFVAGIFVSGVVVSFALYTLTGSGSQTVSIPATVSSGVFSTCDVNGGHNTCTIAAGGQSATFTLPSLTTAAATNIMDFTVQNTGNQAETYSVSGTSSASGIATVSCTIPATSVSPAGTISGSCTVMASSTPGTSGTTTISFQVSASP